MAKRRGKSEAATYLEHLRAALRYLTAHPSVAAYARDLRRSCSLALSQLANAKGDDWAVMLPAWRLGLATPAKRGQEGCREVIMAASIEASKGIIQIISIPISIVVTNAPEWCAAPSNGPDAVGFAIRRIHFDWDASVSEWCKSHLQVGGRGGELGTPAPVYAVAAEPSEPRIPYPRYDLVLSLDLVLREFRTTLNLPQDSAWRGLVRDSERLLLHKYFAGVSQHLQAGTEPLHEFLARDALR